MTTDLILGTAGHIDHGKTSLIKSLTGVDTDRLPEEKKRGITIELGFAELTVGPFRLGIVDVPGHERFVRQMLAGATGMDLAMLVVAADDSVKPQTREHLEVLRILDLPAGVIVLTKCDLADPDWIGLVEDEVRELVQGTFLASAPLVRTSVVTGQGLDDLREALSRAAQQAADSPRMQRRDAPFRMAIDRVFTMPGYGTVVTGSVSSGQVQVGEQLVVEPGAIEVRVRGLQNHDRVVESVGRGQRAAINLVGIHHEQVTRGHELAAPGFLLPSRLITARLDVLPVAPRPIKLRQHARLHVGTAEVLATVGLLDADRLMPGQSGWAQLYLREPVVTTWDQPLVLRSESPAETIAGGRVLAPNAEKIRHVSLATRRSLTDLSAADPLQRAAAAIYFAGTAGQNPADLARLAGVRDGASVLDQLRQQGRVLKLAAVGQRPTWVHVDRLAEYAERVRAVLERLHDRHPLQTQFDRTSLSAQFTYLGGSIVFEAVLQQLERSGQIRLSHKGVGLSHRGPQLSRGERDVMGQLVERYRTAGFQPPTVRECQQGLTRHQKVVPQLIALAASEGDLVEISSEFYLHSEIEQQLRNVLRAALADGPGLTVSEIRERLQTSRKYAVPICEYLDRIGFTQRDGDLRRLNPAASIEASSGSFNP